MGNIIFEIISTLLLFVLTVYLWNFGKKYTDIPGNGWKLVIAGFILIFIGHFATLFDEFWLTSKYVKGKQMEFILENIVGDVIGYLVLAAGLIKWMPTMASAEKLQNEVIERKKAEASLMEKTSLLSGLLNSIPDAVYFKQKDGKYLGCNRAYSDLIKLPAKEIIGKTDFDLFPKEMTDSTFSRDREVFESGKVYTYEDRMDLQDD